MKKMMPSLRGSQQGFTLVELMVVVLIIGFLAAMGTSSFKGYQARSRQTEAKMNLAALYTAEKAFYAQWSGYTGDFRDLGFLIEGRNLKYDLGFASNGWSPITAGFMPASSGGCGPQTAFNTDVSPCAVGVGTVQASATFVSAPASGSCGAGMDPTPNAFRATAVGAIGGAMDDIWTIDHFKSICQNQSGQD